MSSFSSAVRGVSFADTDYLILASDVKFLRTLFLLVCPSRAFKKLPEYKYLSNTGPSHKPKFKVSVNIEKSKTFTAIGVSKKNAESLAAKKLIENLKID